jgi:hypothetical protein
MILDYKCAGIWRMASALLGEKQRSAAVCHGNHA